MDTVKAYIIDRDEECERIQKKLLELLDEVENICKENDIDYFLSDHLAYYACTDHLYPDNFAMLL